MRKIIFILFAYLFICNNVLAKTHDVQAKYETSYNVNLVTTTINKGTKNIKLDDYSLTISTTLNNINIVIIKVEGKENEYVKSITKNNENYYVAFYQNGKKINESNVDIDIQNSNKVLNIYDNEGNIIDTSNNSINLRKNNYFMTISNIIDNEDNNYKIIDVNSFIEDLKDIEINSNSNIQIYNYKNISIEKTQQLGTGYRVIVNNLGNISEYKIIVKGDITGDAKINLNDITRLYHYYKNIEQMDNIFVLAGDVANNNVINLNDITKIYHYYKGIIQSL